ncbi:glycosyltransferase [Bradyrhizobium acaciae]|uniref:glycosyltransferase n=1 Tax=Bradyrhizobium acaciae TaxID=2683706 RepID=UPI001E41A82F|nr:glycosyltransferase [Bradyrhizobium acaciae]MCC8980670.1 glycosyltransferase [Bradyrhizobium acaciae]
MPALKRMLRSFAARSATALSRGILRLAVYAAPGFGAVRLWRGQPRTLWGVTPILTLDLKARADRVLGFRSASLVYATYVITSRFDLNLQRPYLLALRHGLGPAFQRVVLAWALIRYDVFHFFADRGLLDSTDRLQISFEELAALRRAGKRVYIYAYGADVRTRQATLALGKWNFCVDCTEAPKYCTCHDAQAQRYVSEMSKNVTALVSLGDMLTYMPTAKHINYWPLDLDRLSAALPDTPSGPLRIAHAPNHTHFKGSKYLERTIDGLKAQGYDIEYCKIQGVPNSEVLALFAQSDVVADQFIGGAYGYTALEAMALGKPVLSFVRSADLVEAPEECPIINATPDELEQALLWIIRNRNCLRKIGEQGRRYVERWHGISAVAARLGQLYRDTANFPPIVVDRIRSAQDREEVRRNALPVVGNWQHPFQIARLPASEGLDALMKAP